MSKFGSPESGWTWVVITSMAVLIVIVLIRPGRGEMAMLGLLAVTVLCVSPVAFIPRNGWNRSNVFMAILQAFLLALIFVPLYLWAVLVRATQ
jgi:hypothetical protein